MINPLRFLIVPILQLKYIKSAVFSQDYPKADRPEIIVTGRSNAGKSSFFNALGGSPKIAKVSQSPGKTRLLNFFTAGTKYYMVDSPGYGYSKRGGDEQTSWHEMVEEYLLKRESLCGVLLLIDAKREWEEDERMLVSYTQRIGIPIAILVTKVDRMKRAEIEAAVARFQKSSRVSLVFPISAEELTGIEEVEEFIFKNWVKNFKGREIYE